MDRLENCELEVGKGQRYVFWLFFSTITFLLLLLIVKLVAHFYRPDVDLILKLDLELFNASPEYFIPEPVERMRYLASLLSLPFVLIGSYYLAGLLSDSRHISENIRKTLVSFCVFQWLYFLIIYASGFQLSADFFEQYLGNGILKVYPWLYFIPFLASLCIVYYSRAKAKFNTIMRKIIYSLLFFFVISYFLTWLFNLSNYWANAKHLNAVLYSISQVNAGRNILVDFPSQYGWYAYFLLPIFKLVGLSIIKYSIVMSALKTACLILVFFVLNGIIKNSGVLILVFASTAYFGLGYLYPDPYFQYVPLRLLFPALAIWLSFRYIFDPKKTLYLLSFFLFAFGIWWNIDSGIVVFASWFLLVAFIDLVKYKYEWKLLLKKMAMHVYWLICSLLTSIAFLLLLVYLRSGTLIDYHLLLGYQQLFYLSGFMALRIPEFGIWQILIAVYVSGLAWNIHLFLKNKITNLSKIVFFLSVLGLGLFSYYQGRSHDMVLVPVTLCGWLILGIYLDQIILHYKNTRSHFSLQLTAIVMFAFIFSLSLTNVLINFRHVIDNSARGWNVGKNQNSSIRSNIEFIKGSLTKQKTLVVSADSESIYYAELGLQDAIKAPSSTELILYVDIDNIAQQIVDQDLNIFYVSHNRMQDKIYETIKKNYNVKAISPNGEVYQYDKIR